MHLATDPAHIQNQIEVQIALAAMAAIDKIRAMHEDLERLYRSQLIALVTAERLAASTEVAVAQWRLARSATEPPSFASGGMGGADLAV